MYWNTDDRVRSYAMGKQDIGRYKELLGSSKPKNNYIKINWQPKRGFMKKFIAKFWSKQPMKSYRMINRLKTLNH